MKKKLAIVTDSTTHFEKEYCKENQLYVAPIYLLDGENSWRETDELVSPAWFYEKLTSSAAGIKTSQPSIGETVELFQNLLEEYDNVLVFSFSSKASGTFQSFNTAKELTSPEKITIFDTESAGIAKDLQIMYAVEQLEKNKTVETILLELEERKDKTHFYVIPADLQQLHRSGRVKTSQFYLGSLLQIKPILSVKDGIIGPCDKVRTYANIKKWIFKKIAEIKDTVEPTLYLYGTYEDDDEMAQYKSELQALYPTWDIRILPFPYSLAVHVGKGSKGFIIQSK